jgi:hypothetical protein
MLGLDARCCSTSSSARQGDGLVTHEIRSFAAAFAIARAML